MNDEPKQDCREEPRRWHLGALGVALVVNAAVLVVVMVPGADDAPGLGLVFALLSAAVAVALTSLGVLVVHLGLAWARARPSVRWLGYGLPSVLLFSLAWLLAPDNPPNQQWSAPSPVGEHVADMGYQDGRWLVTILDGQGTMQHQVAPEPLWNLHAAYWSWDAQGRFWLYHSDTGSIWSWERQGDAWSWGPWHGDGCDLDRPRPPGQLWPDYVDTEHRVPHCDWREHAEPLDVISLEDSLEAALAGHVDDPARTAALRVVLDSEAARLVEALGSLGELDPERLRGVLLRQVVASLEDKLAQQPPLRLDAEVLERTVIRFEARRLERYVTNGAFPKRWFGYLDQRGDTADRERVLLESARCATRVINTFQDERGSSVTVNDAEIAVTFLAEGGALLLGDRQRLADRIHPIHTLGMDDIALVLLEDPELAQRLDDACGTALRDTVQYTERGWFGPSEPEETPPGVLGRLDDAHGHWAWLRRELRFEEGVIGTALMWRWEKERAAAILEDEGRTPLYERSVAEQFVVGSLVYNAGLAHDEDTIARLLAGEAGPLLWERSEANAHRRAQLPVLPPEQQLHQLLRTASYREQPTSWLAAYHIAQRHGAWEALMELTDRFDDEGMVQ